MVGPLLAETTVVVGPSFVVEAFALLAERCLSVVWHLSLVPSPEDLVSLRNPPRPGTARKQTELFPAAKSGPTQTV